MRDLRRVSDELASLFAEPDVPGQLGGPATSQFATVSGYAEVRAHGRAGQWQGGEIFRWHVQNHTKLGAQVRRVMSAGELVGDDLVETVVHARIEQHDWNYGFVIDGFPRNRRQAEFFLESYDIDAVIHLDLPDDEVRRRVLVRRLCSSCGVDYNLMAHRPRLEGRCDVCGGELVMRRRHRGRAGGPAA